MPCFLVKSKFAVLESCVQGGRGLASMTTMSAVALAGLTPWLPGNGSLHLEAGGGPGAVGSSVPEVIQRPRSFLSHCLTSCRLPSLVYRGVPGPGSRPRPPWWEEARPSAY